MHYFLKGLHVHVSENVVIILYSWSSLSREKCLKLNIHKKNLRFLGSLSHTDWRWIHLKTYNAFSWKYELWTIIDSCNVPLCNFLEIRFLLHSSKWKYLFSLKQTVLCGICICILVSISIILLNNVSTYIRLSLHFKVIFMYAYGDFD